MGRERFTLYNEPVELNKIEMKNDVLLKLFRPYTLENQYIDVYIYIYRDIDFRCLFFYLFNTFKP